MDNAMDLIPSPPWSEDLMGEFFDLTIEEALSYGLTSIHDADTSPARIDFFRKYDPSVTVKISVLLLKCSIQVCRHRQTSGAPRSLPCLSAFAYSNSGSQIRLYLMGYIESNEYWGAKIPRLLDYGTQRRLNLRSVKLFADGVYLMGIINTYHCRLTSFEGALGSWSAALLNPYTDDTRTAGLLRYAPDNLAELIRQFHVDGWQTVNKSMPFNLPRLSKKGIGRSLHRGQSQPAGFGYLRRYSQKRR